LVITVFSENDYKLPRRSEEQAKEGTRVEVQSVKPEIYFSLLLLVVLK
jgi:hypothetical protein